MKNIQNLNKTVKSEYDQFRNLTRPVQEEKDALKEAEIILDAKSVLDNAHKDEQSKLLEQLY